MFSRYLYSRVMESISMQSVKLILAEFEIDFLDSIGVKYERGFDNNTLYYTINPNDLISRIGNWYFKTKKTSNLFGCPF